MKSSRGPREVLTSQLGLKPTPGVKCDLSPKERRVRENEPPLRRPPPPERIRLLYFVTPEMIPEPLAALTRGEFTALPPQGQEFTVRLVHPVRETIERSGLEEKGIQRLYDKLTENLGNPATLSRFPRWTERPECVLYHTLVGSPTLIHIFTFVLVIQTEQKAVGVLACEHHPLRKF